MTNNENETSIVERLIAKVNIAEIIDSLSPLFEKYPIVRRSQAVGGWALQSTNSSYKDGWTMDFCPYNGPRNIGPTWTPKTESEQSLPEIQKYVVPTELTTEPIKNLLADLETKGLNPRRARIIKLSANSSTVWHQDGSKIFYQCRLHIPLVTNEECFFETEDGRYHMRADGSIYFVHINRVHRVVNFGDKDRLHFLAHIWDQNEITSKHRYDANEFLGETVHPD